jgi:hypothetical protein
MVLPPRAASGGLMRFTLAWILCIGLLVSVTAANPDVTTKVIDGEVYYYQPLGPCEVPGVVFQIAKIVQVPAGIERMPEVCTFATPMTPAVASPPRERAYLTGKTVGEALNELVAADPRYYWVESDAVIVIRPVAAWADQQHFLHRTLPSLRVIDQNLGGALDEWRRAMWGAEARPPADYMRASQPTEGATRLFSVVLDRPHTAIDALDHIVRAHGALYWEVAYCRPLAIAGHATVWLRTLEHRPYGWGVSMKERFVTVGGKTVDACGGKI